MLTRRVPAYRNALPFILLLTAACAKVPEVPKAETWSWEVDRSSLPDADLYAMHVATITGARSFFVKGGGKGKMTGPVSSYLIDHPTEGLVLIDTAFGRATAESRKSYPGALQASMVGLEMGRPVVEQLPEGGFDPADVAHMVVTHLHMDHAGGIADFPGAALWVDEREWKAASKSRLPGYKTGPYDNADPRFLDFEGTAPYGPFPGHVDMFGDGSLIVLPSPGHTAGSVMVLVNLPEASWLFTGDTTWVDDHYHGPTPKSWMARTVVEDDADAAWEGTIRTHHWAEAHPELNVVPGHEPATVERLNNWPLPENVGAVGGSLVNEASSAPDVHEVEVHGEGAHPVEEDGRPDAVGDVGQQP